MYLIWDRPSRAGADLRKQLLDDVAPRLLACRPRGLQIDIDDDDADVASMVPVPNDELPVRALWGVGPVTARKLRNIGLEKLVQVRDVDIELLRRTVGSLADWLRQLSHGDDPRPVVPDRESKSSSTENTYAEDVSDLETIRAEIDRMARENAEWLERRKLLARTVTIKVRYADFKTVTRSHTLSQHTADADLIASWAAELMARTEAGARPVRLLGVRVTGLVEQPAR